MYQVSNEQVEFILHDLQAKGIELEELRLDLLDHICLIIENTITSADQFNEVYSKVLKQFYIKDIKEIEEETLILLTYKNYYAMKKMMFLTGAFSTFAFLAGSLFKIMHWPAANVLLMLAIGTFGLIFLPLVFLVKTPDTPVLRERWVLGLATVCGILYSLSIILQINHWRGKHEVWLLTLCISFFILVPLYFFSGIRKPETRNNTIVTTILLMGMLGMQFAMTALGPPKNQQVSNPVPQEVSQPIQH